MPLYDFDHRCQDPRYPRLVGPFVVGCDARGQVERVLDLSTGQQHELPVTFENPSVGEGAIYEPGRGGALVLLVPGEPPAVVDDIATVRDQLVAPAATDGTHVAVLGRGSVQAFRATDKARRLVETEPMGWYPPALVWPRVAWVARGQGEDVLWLDATASDSTGRPQALAVGPGHQRHVVAQGRWLAWVEPEGLVLLHVDTGERREFDARTGFSAPPTLWEGEACWETRDAADVDVICSDGMEAKGPGHQQWPSRWDRWLLYREGTRLMLYTAPAPEPGDTGEVVP